VTGSFPLHEPLLQRAGDPARSRSALRRLWEKRQVWAIRACCGRGRPRAVCQWFIQCEQNPALRLSTSLVGTDSTPSLTLFCDGENYIRDAVERVPTS
jgi:hypothetical protein